MPRAPSRPRAAMSLAVTLTAALGAGCVDFVDPTLGVCGNRIVEPGEACDDPDDIRCGAANRAQACLVLCDPAIGASECAPGQGCGIDGVCRTPSGEFAAPVSLALGGYQRMVAGDLNGDGTDDVVAQFAVGDPDARAVESLYLTVADGALTVDVFPLLAHVAGDFAVGDLDGDRIADVVVVSEAAPTPDAADDSTLAVFLGSSAQAATPSYFPTIATTGPDARLLNPTPDADRALELVDAETTRVWSARSASATEVPPLTLAIDLLGGSIPWLDSVDNGDCPEGPLVASFARPELFLAVDGAEAVAIVSTCADDQGFEPVGAVTLPAGRLGDAGSFLVDADGDPWSDLLAQDEQGAVWLAHGVADGSFHSGTPVPAGDGDGMFSATPVLLGASAIDRLLAAADLDADGLPELVSATNYYPAPEACDATCEAEPWPDTFQYARTVDINGDGRLDVAALAGDRLFIALAGSLGPTNFEVHAVALNGPAHELVSGDFDRDTVADLAFVERRSEYPTPAADLVKILYGGDVDDWRLEGLGSFIEVTRLAVGAGSTVVARTQDLEGHPAGAFLRPGAAQHRFGYVLRSPAIVRVEGGAAVAALVGRPPESTVRLALLEFIGGSLAPQDILEGDAVDLDAGDDFFAQTRAIDVDGDAVDELLILGVGAHDNLRLARLDSAGMWRIEQAWSIGPGFARAPAEGEHGAPSPPGGGPGSAVTVADVDLDDDLDALATTDESPPRVVLLRNADDALTPTLLTVAPEDSEPFTIEAIVRWHADGVDAARFLVGGPDGSGLATLASDATELAVRRLHDEPVVALAAADLGGDGLLDFIVASPMSVSVARARASTSAP